MKNIKELISKLRDIGSVRGNNFITLNAPALAIDLRKDIEEIIQALLPDMPEEKPDEVKGYIAWNGKDELEQHMQHDMIGLRVYLNFEAALDDLLESRKPDDRIKEIAKRKESGWQIRPVKLQFMDGKK